MHIEESCLIQERFRNASFQYDTKSGAEDTAMSILVLSLVALLAMFVCDLSAFALAYVWLARTGLIGVIVCASVYGYRAGTETRAAEKTMNDLRNDNPTVPLPY